MKLPTILLISICAAGLMTGCANNPAADQSADATATTPTCKTNDAPTGSNIRSHKCGAASDVQTVDPQELMRSRPAVNMNGDPSRSH